MTLKEKVAAACENAETTEEAAAELRKNMTEQEKQSAWGKHQTHLKNNPKEAKEVNKMNKTEKGLAAAIYLLKKEQPRFLQVKKMCQLQAPWQKVKYGKVKNKCWTNLTKQNLRPTLHQGE